MKPTFDPDAFIQRVGRRLVEEFDTARTATSPSTVGAAMEQPVREQLAQILPPGIGVGSGFVIDIYGQTSRQIDIVLYERDICPVFSINGTPGTTYYPCEGVLAVGEVKSALDGDSLKDAFSKISSVKELTRQVIYHLLVDPKTGSRYPSYRNYASMRDDSLHDISKSPGDLAQIYGFVLAGSTRLAEKTLAARFLELNRKVGDVVSPNLLVVLSGTLLSWGRVTTEQPPEVRQHTDGKHVLTIPQGGPPAYAQQWSTQSADLLGLHHGADPFRELVRCIRDVYRRGRTSAIVSLDNYFQLRDSSAHKIQTFGKTTVD